MLLELSSPPCYGVMASCLCRFWLDDLRSVLPKQERGILAEGGSDAVASGRLQKFIREILYISQSEMFLLKGSERNRTLQSA